MQYFQYGEAEIAHLSKRDPNIASVIRRFGFLQRKLTPDIFPALVECIVGQQVSSKAAATVNQRLMVLLHEISPARIASIEPERIQRCGMTMKKALCIRTAAQAWVNGSVNPEKYPDMADEEIIRELVQLPGVGRWTAEMLLLHSLQRRNVWSYDDLVIRKSLMSIHGLPTINRGEFRTWGEAYSPFCSVAMIYLWKYGAMTPTRVS